MMLECIEEHVLNIGGMVPHLTRKRYFNVKLNYQFLATNIEC